MNDDPRCCGTGTCIINAEGVCWYGQKWDGEKMCFPQDPRGTVNAPTADSAQTGKTLAPGGDRPG
ncbi:MAG: hypothetical protein RL522_1978 [Pseudomonadota bacterium]|jgi:hypothetical protein